MANVDASLIHAFVNVTPETKRAKAGYVPVQIELDEKIRNQVRVAEVTPPRVRVYQR
jgi:hypothetical protein